MDKDLQEICWKIYNEHRDAIDLIIDNRPDTLSAISDFIAECLGEIKNKEKLFIKDTSSTKKYIRFTTELIEKELPLSDDKSFGCGIGASFLYEFECKDGWVGFSAYIFNQKDEKCKKIFELCQRKFAEYGVKKPSKLTNRAVIWRRTILNNDEIISFGDETTKNDIKNKLSKAILDLFPQIRALEKDIEKVLNN